MGFNSIWHWIIVIALILLLFGRGKVSELMGDVAKGIKSFKKGMAEDEPEQPRTIVHNTADAAPVDRAENKTKVG
jgi:sec-independent protein translocase protein TatA